MKRKSFLKSLLAIIVAPKGIVAAATNPWSGASIRLKEEAVYEQTGKRLSEQEVALIKRQEILDSKRPPGKYISFEK